MKILLSKTMLCLYFFSFVFGLLYLLPVEFGPYLSVIVNILIVISLGLYALKLKRERQK